MTIKFTQSSWGNDNPSRAELPLLPNGLVQNLEWSKVCIDGISSELTLAGKY